MKKQHKVLLISTLLIILSLMLMSCSLTNLISQFMGSKTMIVEEKAATIQVLQTEIGIVTEEAPTETEKPAPVNGTLTGQLTYPSEFLPPQRVVAFDITDLTTFYVDEVVSGGTYSLEIPAGTYYVLAYLIDPALHGGIPDYFAAYSEAVLCGLAYGCDDHSLVPVFVGAGETVSGIDPTDWYLPPGEDAGWPSDPVATEPGANRGNLGSYSGMPTLEVNLVDFYASPDEVR
jgi:hypothetical protein